MTETAGLPGTAPTSSPPTAPPPTRLGRRFVTVWVGQTASSVGSNVSAMGAAVWVYLESGSALWLGLLTALSTVPQLVTAPLLPIVDRVPRRTMMIATDAFGALGLCLALPMALAGRLEVWHLAVLAVLTGIGGAFQYPAAQAAVPLLVAPGALGRANGMMQLGPAVGAVAGPLIATPLVARWGMTPVLLVDVATFLLAVATLVTVRFDAPAEPATDAVAGPGWRPAVDWLRGAGRPVLRLMLVGTGVNFVLAFFNIAVIALATSVGGAARAGVPIAAAGSAMVVGAIVASARGVSPDRIRVFAVGLIVMMFGCVLAAARPNLVLVAVGAAIAICLAPAINAASATVYQERVPQAIQGRVFGLRSVIGQGMYPVGAALSGLAIDHVGGPLMDGVLSGSVGRLIGSGAERGAALVLLAVGMVVGAAGIWLLGSRIRRDLHADAPVAG